MQCRIQLLSSESPSPPSLSPNPVPPTSHSPHLPQYHNIFSLLRELDLPEWPLTEFTTSGFWNPKGLVTEAPVFSKLPQLPTLVGQFFHTSPLYWSLSLQDRLTMLPFLTTFFDYDSSPETYEK